jgi:heme oxygenase
MMVQMNTMSSTKASELKLIDRMKEATREIHTKVENRQFIQDLVKGQATPEAYLQYLVDLKCIYGTLEIELDQSSTDPKISAIIIPELYRSKKLEKDIQFFINATGITWPSPSQEAFNFRDVIRDCAFNSIHKLAAYAYIRMLGDLFGGRDIGTAVLEKWKEGSANFYDYSELIENRNVESLPRFAYGVYRPAFNQLALTIQEENELVAEAVKAFELTDALLLSYERK